ncbi:MAG TPA: hypothetical protein VHG09_05185, partial [Longimicrobiales bacterium]|nr:hypothetical protein [Longimicrobiales bacterium]
RPGKVRPMVKKFLAMADIMEKQGFPRPKVMTDMSGQRFWTVVSEFEVESFEAFASMGADDDSMKEADKIMSDYHDLVDSGHREIYNLEK